MCLFIVAFFLLFMLSFGLSIYIFLSSLCSCQLYIFCLFVCFLVIALLTLISKLIYFYWSIFKSTDSSIISIVLLSTSWDIFVSVTVLFSSVISILFHSSYFSPGILYFLILLCIFFTASLSITKTPPINSYIRERLLAMD